MREKSTTRPLGRALLEAQPDARLVELAQRDEESAFAEIDRRYRLPLIAFAAAYAPRDRAEDVVQESFERSWIAIREGGREIKLKPWLYAVVRNAALNARRQVRYDKELDETIDGVRRPEEIVLERSELERVVAAVAALPERQRQALVGNALDGRTHEQIAEALGTTPGSIRGLIHRARSAVRTAAAGVVPLPLLRALLDSGSAEAGAALATGAGVAGGGGLLLKGAGVAAIGALAIGSGVAIDRAADGRDSDPPAERRERAADGRDAARISPAPAPVSASNLGAPPTAGSSQGSGGGNSSGDDGPQSENEGPEVEVENEGPEIEAGDDSSGPSPSSGPSASSGSDSDDSDSDDDSSGSGSSGSGSSGSGSSGSGSSGSGSSSSGSGGGDLEEVEVEEPEEVEVEEPDVDNSGSGSSSSGSGSSGSG